MNILNGLTSLEVRANREKYGTNKLPEPKLKTGFQFFMGTFENRLNQILLAMMVVFAVIAVMGQGSFAEPAGVFVVLLAIAAIGTKTGLKSQKSDRELKAKTSTHFCNVLRDGGVQHINTNDIVVGDVIIIQSGESIYADGYLVEGQIKVDNSVLNGEPEECKKTAVNKCPYNAATRNPSGDDYVDNHSLFAGAIITEGEGKMVVTNVGVGKGDYPGTVNGKTITAISEIEQQKTSLEIQLDDLARQISKFGYAGAAIIILALIVTNILRYGGLGGSTIEIVKNVLTIAVTALTIVVAAVPEGLPLIINLITAQNAKVMIRNNVLAKHTNKIPEAGNIDLLCTDKTGTLTKGVLVPVHNIMANGKEVNTSEFTGKVFAVNAILNNDAMYDSNGEIVGGNATDRAVLSMFDYDRYTAVKNEYTINSHRPFNSAYKFSAIETEYNGELITFYKGAPERFVNAAYAVLIDGSVHEIDKNYLTSKIEEFTSKAMRVIATGYSLKPIDFDSNSLPDDMVITSLIAIRDDVRPEVPAAVKQVQDAGVQVMMITGDVISTAKAIAIDAGIIRNEDDLAYTADEIAAMSDEELKSKLSRIKVIARATPDTKLRIVHIGQALGRCVAMTGDGTNDGPALKAADVGFGMGSGTDVCKEASDIIITDDNFVSITKAILLGRTFMHNVMKFLKFQLPINISLVITSILYPIILGVEAMAAVQILVINIVMDSLNSLSFGGEPAKDEYMKEKPIKKGSKLLSKDTIGQIGASVAAFIALFAITLLPQIQNIYGNEEVYATARFVMLIYMATFNGFNIRTDGMNLFAGIDKNKLFGEIAIAIFALTFILSQFGGAFMGCTTMSLTQWIVTIILAFMVIPIDMIRKMVVNGGKI